MLQMRSAPIITITKIEAPIMICFEISSESSCEWRAKVGKQKIVDVKIAKTMNIALTFDIFVVVKSLLAIKEFFERKNLL